jgi:hypothetical protein
MKNLAIHAILAWLPLSLFTAALHGDPVPPRPDATIFVVTGSFGSGGALVSMQRQSPWDAVTVAEWSNPRPI